MSMNEKDVVAGKIIFDTSKILPGLKPIDEGVRKNAESFKALNAELVIAEKNYVSMAKAMDKMALTSDERRKKILDESNALVAQRKASADLLTAKKNQLDMTNQVVESKYQAQQAIVKKRTDAIEQQEKEHQQRMATLQQKTAAAGSNDNLVQTKIDRQFQLMKNGDTKMEMQAERHAAMMKRLSDSVNQRNILGPAAGYMMAGSLYYNAVSGAKEAIKVIEDFEDTVVNLRRVMSSGVDIKFVEKSMIQDAKDYGFALKDVGAVYVDIAQQGFNEKDTAALARTALMAKNVESSFKDASQAQQLLTGAIKNYNLEASGSEPLLDRLNQVSNDYATDSNKLLQGINRTGAAAKNAGVPINDLIGYLTVLNEAGFSGAVAGNSVKSFISFSSRDIAIDKLEAYVGTIKKTTGEMMPFSQILERVAGKWKTLSDVQRAEITQAIARGDQASRFIALMDNYDKVVKVAATAENSLGSAQRENALAMTTLSKQSAQLKASWEGLMVTIGDSGLLSILKSIVHESKLLVDGFNSLPGPIRNTLIVTLSLGAGILALNTGMRLLTGQSLVAMVTGLTTATKAMFGVKAATEAATVATEASTVATVEANVAQKAFIATPIGASLTALAAVIGIVTLAWSHHNGTQNETTASMDNNQKEAFSLGEQYKSLKKIVDDSTKSDKEIKTAKDELAGIVVKLTSIMPDLTSAFDKNGQAIDINIGKLDEWKNKYAESVRLVEEGNIKQNSSRKLELESQIEYNKQAQSNFEGSDLSIIDKMSGKSVNDYRKAYAEKVLADGKELETINQKLKSSQETLDLINGKTTPKTTSDKSHTGPPTDEEVQTAYTDNKQSFDDEMARFHHLVNIESNGYTEAVQQSAKLKEIKSRYKGLNEEDLFGIDEEIHRTDQGIKTKAKGFKGAGSGNRYSMSLNDIDNQKIQAENQVNSAMALIDQYAAKEFSLSASIDKVSQKTVLYTGHQTALHSANILLKNSLDELTSRQGVLNELYSAGKITSEEYNKSTEDVQSRLKTINQDMSKNSSEWWKDEKEEFDLKDKRLQDSYDFSEKWIAHEKATREMSAEEEYKHWLDVQARYKKGTEQRAKADEMVYTSKKALIKEQETLLEKAFNKEKDLLNESKQKELDAIDEAKRKYVEAQDVKIRAIEDQIKAQDQANSDSDYNASLKEKQDRLTKLASAVGPDGIKERKALQKEIEKMQLDHTRELSKRDLEVQKQALEDEKSANEKKYEQDKRDIEDHYKDLLKAFDGFTNDTTGRAETLKNIQIAKDLEKNTTILANLDTFIADYQSKMSAIANLSQSQEELDLQKYNSNIDKWNTGSAAEKSTAHTENDALRMKYGVKDSGKLQHFADGGVVQGRRGEAVPVIAHAGEPILSESQQSNLFKLLNFSMPQMKFSMPSFDMGKSSTTQITNHWTISSGDVNLHDDADIQTYFNERNDFVTRTQAVSGVKQR